MSDRERFLISLGRCGDGNLIIEKGENWERKRFKVILS
jgi:hypothetical protein